jgi:hypothetical protein
MKRRRVKDPGQAYVKSLDEVEQIEKKMARLFNAWLKAKARLRSVNRKLDEMQISLGEHIPTS